MKHANDNTKPSQLVSAVKNLPRPHATNVYFEHLRERFWMQGDGGRWQCYRRSDLRIRLRIDYQLDGSSRDGQPAEVDEELDRIVRQQVVDAALPLAGYNAGHYTICRSQVLVTSSPTPLMPVEGEHTMFYGRLKRMFGPKQADLFCGWLKFALMDYYEFLQQQTGRNVGMGLVVGGPSGLGKSLLLKLIDECFGGGKAYPAQHAKGSTSFNNDLISAVIQAFDDEGMGDSYSNRKEVGDFVKRTVAVDEQRCHPKGKDAFPVKVFWRLVFCLNDEAENLQVLPPLERGVQDKLIMLKATGALLDEIEAHRSRNENWSMLSKEIVYFIRWLLDDFEVQKTLLDARFGMKAWQHEDLAKGVDSFAPELKLLDMIDDRPDLFDGRKQITLMAREIEKKLKEDLSSTLRDAYDLLRSAGSVGKYLGKLAVKRPDRVKKAERNKRGDQYWQLTAVAPECLNTN